MDRKLSIRLADIYCSPRGYWRGFEAIKKLVSAAKTSEDVAQAWLKNQAIWQIYLAAPRHIPRPKFDIATPNEVHQADLLFLPHDRVGKRTYKNALIVVDVASRYKGSEPLATKETKEVAEECFANSWLTEPMNSRPGSTWSNLGHLNGQMQDEASATSLAS